MSTLIDSLNWRIATKIFDPTKKVAESDLEELLEALRLSPSSLGLQPWKFIVVTNAELRKQLREASNGQPQVTDASHLIILASRTGLTKEYVEHYMETVAMVRGATLESLQPLRTMIDGYLGTRSDHETSAWLAKQAYIALGVLLTACALKGIDACPMEGFNREKVDEILGLEKLGLSARTFCPIGYRSEKDWLAKLPKVRFCKEELVITM